MAKKEVKYVAAPSDTSNKEKKYSLVAFFIKVVSTAILIAFGIIIILNKGQAEFAILLVSGFAAIIAALIRIFTIVLRTNYKRTRVLSFIEIAIHCVIGLFIIFTAYQYNTDPESNFVVFSTKTLYHLLVAFILYSRALVYFWTTILYHEKTKKSQFWVHVACMTLGCAIAALNDFTPEQLAIALAVLAFCGAIVVGGETGFGYFRYRKNIAPAKEKKDEVKEEDILPAQDETPMIDPNIIGDNKPEQEHDIIS